MQMLSPTKNWLQGAAVFAALVFLLGVVGSFYLITLVPVALVGSWMVAYSWLAWAPGRLAIELSSDQLVYRQPLSAVKVLPKNNVTVFMVLRVGKVEFAVARMAEGTVSSLSSKQIKSDVVFSKAFMTPHRLVAHLERWRTNSV